MKFSLCRLNPHFYKRSRLRTSIRGYHSICKNKKIGLFRKIKSELSQVPVPRVTNEASPYFFGASIFNAERVVRQLLLDKCANSKMYNSILYSIGNSSSVRYAMPKIWREEIQRNGVEVNQFFSSLGWFFLLLARFSRGFLSIFKIIKNMMQAQMFSPPLGAYVYFDGLTPNNLPQINNKQPSYDICTWYSKWEGRGSLVKVIRHNAQKNLTSISGLNVEGMDAPPYLLFRSPYLVAKFFAWCVLASMRALIELMCGRWWHAFILEEAVKAKAMSFAQIENIAEEYLFHYSGSVYRPMWTYEAEKKGSRVILYFYSVFEQPRLPQGYESQKYEWGASSWPIHLVWDKWQKEQLKRDLEVAPEIHIVGPIYFSDGAENIQFTPNSIAVFDVEPHKLSKHFPQSTLSEYLAEYPDLNVRFLNDIQTVLSEMGQIMVIKRKRDVSGRTRRGYLKALKEISSKAGVVFLPSSISPCKVINQSVGVISIPFTSTALLAQAHDVPSVYYDPTGWINKNDRAAHNVPVISGIDELRRWIKSLPS